MNWRKVTIGVLAAVFGFMLLGAIGSHLFWQRAPLDGWGSASFLFVAGALVFFSTPQPDRLRLLLVGGIGYVAEVVGVNYGWLFGRYVYTDVLAPTVFGSPVAMICAWFILIGYVRQLLLPFTLPSWIEIFLGGAWMTAIDLLLDPIAAHPFSFWRWVDGGAYYGIPLRNFWGWFAVSVMIGAIDKVLFSTAWQPNAWARIVGAGILVLYTVCAFGYGYFMAGIVGIVLLGLHGWLRFFAKIVPQSSKIAAEAVPIKLSSFL